MSIIFILIYMEDALHLFTFSFIRNIRVWTWNPELHIYKAHAFSLSWTPTPEIMLFCFCLFNELESFVPCSQSFPHPQLQLLFINLSSLFAHHQEDDPTKLPSAEPNSQNFPWSFLSQLLCTVNLSQSFTLSQPRTVFQQSLEVLSLKLNFNKDSAYFTSSVNQQQCDVKWWLELISIN